MFGFGNNLTQKFMAVAALGAALMVPAGAFAQNQPVPQAPQRQNGDSQYFEGGVIPFMEHVQACTRDGYAGEAAIVIEGSQSDLFNKIDKLSKLPEGIPPVTHPRDFRKELNAVWKSILSELTNQDFTKDNFSDKGAAIAKRHLDEYTAELFKETDIHFRIDQVDTGQPKPGCTP